MLNEIYVSAFTILDYEHTNIGAAHVLMTYVFPTLACLTIFGNTLFILSIAFADLRKKTTGMLLMSSNICSIIQTVSSCIIVYYPWLIPEQTAGTPFPCNILVVSYHLLATWSVYLLTCATIDRYIAICHPMSRFFISSHSAVKQCIRVVIGTFIASCVLSAPLIWFSGLTVIGEVPDYGNITFCYYLEENWYMEVHEYVEMTFYSIIPFLIILFCNVEIIKKICFHKRVMQAIWESQNSGSETQYPRLPHTNQAIRLSKLLLPISVLHLVFSGIVVVSLILKEAVAETAHDKLPLLTISYNAAQLQAGYYFYVNLSLCSVFRDIFKNLFCYRRRSSDTIMTDHRGCNSSKATVEMSEITKFHGPESQI